MPYEVKISSECPKNKPYGVFKKGTDDKMGCHETAKKAHGQIKAIEESEKKELGDEDTVPV